MMMAVNSSNNCLGVTANRLPLVGGSASVSVIFPLQISTNTNGTQKRSSRRKSFSNEDGGDDVPTTLRRPMIESLESPQLSNAKIRANVSGEDFRI